MGRCAADREGLLVGPSAVEREARCLVGRGVKCRLSLLGNTVSIFMGRCVAGWGGLCLLVHRLLKGRHAVWRGGGVRCLLLLLGIADSIFMGRCVVGWGGLCLLGKALLAGPKP